MDTPRTFDKMIKLIEDCEVHELFNKGVEAAQQRYWYFSAYDGPRYTLFWNDEISCEEEDAIIEDFLHPEGNFINIDKFDTAFPHFGMDEWTSIIGFRAAPEKATDVAKFIYDNEMAPEKILRSYPESDVCGFYWIAGWWEAFGNEEFIRELVNQDLINVDTESSEFISDEVDVDSYYRDRKRLKDLIRAKKPN